MLDQTQRSETLPIAGYLDGVPGYWFGRLFIPKMAGGEDDPKPGEGDPPPGDGGTGKDGKPFDADRAQRTIDQLRDEVKAGKAAQKELDAAKARLQEIEDAGKSELERATTKATEAEQKVAAAEARAADLTLRLTVERAAGKMGFHDPDDAYRLIDRKAVELDDEGEPTNVEKLLTDLAKAKPHLVKADDGSGKKAEKSPPQTPKPAPNGTSASEREQRDLEGLRATGRYSI